MIVCWLPVLCSCRGAVQAGLIGFGLFVFATKVEGLVYTRDLPSGYTVCTRHPWLLLDQDRPTGTAARPGQSHWDC